MSTKCRYVVAVGHKTIKCSLNSKNQHNGSQTSSTQHVNINHKLSLLKPLPVYDCVTVPDNTVDV